jgi:hypothetical protein
MNKIYRIIWSKVTGDYCVVGEFAKSGGKGKSSISVSQANKISEVVERNFSVKTIAKNISVIFIFGFFTDIAWAGYIGNCAGPNLNSWTLLGVTGSG